MFGKMTFTKRIPDCYSPIINFSSIGMCCFCFRLCLGWCLVALEMTYIWLTFGILAWNMEEITSWFGLLKLKQERVCALPYRLPPCIGMPWPSSRRAWWDNSSKLWRKRYSSPYASYHHAFIQSHWWKRRFCSHTVKWCSRLQPIFRCP